MDPNTIIRPSVYTKETDISGDLKKYKSAFYGHIYIIILIILALLNDYFHFSLIPINSSLPSIGTITVYIRYYGALIYNILVIIGILLLPNLAFKFYQELLVKPNHKILRYHALIGTTLFIILLGAQYFNVFSLSSNYNVFEAQIYIFLELYIFPLIMIALIIYISVNVYLKDTIDNEKSKRLIIFFLLSSFLVCSLVEIGELSLSSILVLLPGFASLTPVMTYIVGSFIDFIYLIIIGVLILVLSLVMPITNKKQNNIILISTMLSTLLLDIYIIIFMPLSNSLQISLSLQDLLLGIFNLSALNILYFYSIGFIVSISCLFFGIKKENNIKNPNVST